MDGKSKECVWCGGNVDFYYIVWRNEPYHWHCHGDRREYLAHLATYDERFKDEATEEPLDRPRKRLPHATHDDN